MFVSVAVIVMLMAAAAIGTMLVMIMRMMVMPVVMPMMRMAVAGLQKRRLDAENALKIERAAIENFAERYLRFHRADHACIRIDAADARLDILNLFRRDEVGFVEKD